MLAAVRSKLWVTNDLYVYTPQLPKFSIINVLESKKRKTALAGMAQLVERRSVSWKVADLIPSQGTCLGCSSVPGWGAYKKQQIDVSVSHQCFSPFLSPSLPLSPKSIRMSSGDHG